MRVPSFILFDKCKKERQVQCRQALPKRVLLEPYEGGRVLD
jgi:hypothetical protein